MSDRIDDVPPELAALFDAERRAPAGPPDGAQDRVRTALAATLIGIGGAGALGAGSASAATGIGSGAASTAGATVASTTGATVASTAAATGASGAASGAVTTAVAGKATGLVVAAVVASVGAGGVYVATREPTTPLEPSANVVVERPARPVSPLAERIEPSEPSEPSVARETSAPAVAATAPAHPLTKAPPARPKVRPPLVKPTVPVEPLEPVAPLVAPTAPTAPAEPMTPEERASALQAERRLLEQARVAVARGDMDTALAAVNEHTRAFPAGLLVEEREALAVQALAKGGRMDSARARLDAFRTKWPRSLFLKSLDAATAQ